MTKDEVQVVKHPATFSRAILEKLDEIVPDGIYLDPFAGVGKIHRLERKGRKFIGIEIEPEWAAMDPRTVCADALQWMEHHAQYSGQRFDGVVTSPVYGNRMSDHHNPKDASKRHSYKFALGRDLTDGNSGSMYFWQPAYKEFHIEAWQDAWRVTRPSGRMFLNVKNFYRTVKGEKVTQPVIGWHLKTLQSVGWKILGVHRVGTPGMREGENYESRFDGEAIIEAVKL